MEKLPKIKILDEKNKILRTTSKEVTFPLPETDIQRIHDMLKYLEMSQIEETREFYNLRAGMGLAFIQLGIPKRIFVIANKDEDTGIFEEHIMQQ